MSTQLPLIELPQPTGLQIHDTYEGLHAIYITPPIIIGNHEWCCVVYCHKTYGACTDYHWRRTSLDLWHSEKQFPRYDSHDTYNGLPQSLAKLWNRYRAEIETALDQGKASKGGG